MAVMLVMSCPSVVVPVVSPTKNCHDQVVVRYRWEASFHAQMGRASYPPGKDPGATVSGVFALHRSLRRHKRGAAWPAVEEGLVNHPLERLNNAPHTRKVTGSIPVGTTLLASGSQVLETRVFVLCSDPCPAHHRGDDRSLLPKV
jgi:hypothetical protein